VGLFASFAIACVSAVVGGRPGMISAATAATAVVMVSLVRDYGLQYLFAATILMGLIQIAAGVLRLGRVMRFVSRSVITGFVNALAILIFMAQLPELIGVPLDTYPMIAAGLAIIYLFPRLTKAIPSLLVAIAVLTAFAWWSGLELRTVGDLGELPSSLPVFTQPQVPLTLETLQIILPYSLTLAAVGLLESLLTAQIVDDMTDTMSNKSQECVGQGASNIASALIGGMGSCAMIGQSVINVTSGGRGRLSTFVAGNFLLFLILVLDDLVRIIPMAALVAVMIMVSIGTFSWRSILDLRRNPRSSSVVMLATVITVVATHDLAIGVLVGVLLSGVFFAGKVSQLVAVGEHVDDESGRVTYVVLCRLGPDLLRLGRGVPARLRFRPAGARGDDRPRPRAFLGHHLGRRAGQGGAEVSQGRRARGGDRPQRGERHNGARDSLGTTRTYQPLRASIDGISAI
jgi:SulP family sulfate permease